MSPCTACTTAASLRTTLRRWRKKGKDEKRNSNRNERMTLTIAVRESGGSGGRSGERYGDEQGGYHHGGAVHGGGWGRITIRRLCPSPSPCKWRGARGRVNADEMTASPCIVAGVSDGLHMEMRGGPTHRLSNLYMRGK